MKRNGLTLIETLLAVVLGSSVLTVASAVAVQAVRTRHAVRDELHARWERVHVFDTFEADVKHALVYGEDEVETFVVPDSPEQLLQVRTLVWEENPSTAFPRRAPALVTYVFQRRQNEAGGGTLFRDVVYLTDSNRIVHRQSLSGTLLEARVEWFKGKSWTLMTTETTEAKDPPAGVRLVCRWRGEPERPDQRLVALAGRNEAGDQEVGR